MDSKDDITVDGVTFKYNNKYKWYETSFDNNGVNIDLHTYSTEDLNNVLKLAVQYAKDLNIAELKNVIANEYYESDKASELKGVTKEQFLSNLALLSMSVDSESVEYWFNDNDMYGGHSLIVTKRCDEDGYAVTMAG